MLQHPLPPPSRQYSELIWFALQCGKAKQCTVLCDHDHIPESRGCMRVQYPLLMATRTVIPTPIPPFEPLAFSVANMDVFGDQFE